MKCGCGGTIEEGKGCLNYLGSDQHERDNQHETMMRHGGLGFGVFKDVDTATMSMHLQANGLSHEETEEILSYS